MAPTLSERLHGALESWRSRNRHSSRGLPEGVGAWSSAQSDNADPVRSTPASGAPETAATGHPVTPSTPRPPASPMAGSSTSITAANVPSLAATAVQVPATVAVTKDNRRFLSVVLGVAGIGLSLTFIKDLASVIAPIFFGVNLMITVYPVYQWLRRRRLPAWASSLAAGLIVFAILTGFILGLSYSIAAMVNYLPKYSEQFTSLYVQGIDLLASFGFSEAVLLERLKGIDPQSLLGVLTSVLSETQNIASLLLILMTAMIFMVMDTPSFDERLNLARRSHGVFIGALEHFAHGIRKYWVVTTVFGLIVAVLDLAVLIGLGVPLALIWALFSFLTNYIPNVGFVLGVIPPALLALFESGPQTAIAVVAAYSVLNFAVQSIIQPKFAGDAVGLSPSLSFLSLLLWTTILGALGALLALPCSLLVKALLVDADPKARWVNALISSRPADALDAEDVPDSR